MSSSALPWRAWQLGAAMASATGGCSNSSSDAPPTPPPANASVMVLSTGSPTKDEDPSLLAANDRSLCAAWFSDRDAGRQGIYIARSTDGEHWLAPVRVTGSTTGNFNPTLMQDSSGTIHMIWFRWSAPAVGQIMHKSSSSADCTTLATSADDAVTTDADVDDWVPTIAEAADGALLVYFVSHKRGGPNSNNHIYVSRKGRSDTAWSAPVAASLNSSTEHDHLPFVKRTGTMLSMVWVRNDGTSYAPWSAPPGTALPKSDLWFATSNDGLAWSAPVKVTTEPAPVFHLFPAIYQRFDGRWWLLWLSSRLDAATQTPSLFEIPLDWVSPLNRYPLGIEQNTLLHAALPGYTHRIIATFKPGEYLGAWVDGVEPTQDIAYGFYTK